MKASVVVAAMLVLMNPVQSRADQRFALIVSGAAGGAEYATQYDRWSAQLSKTLIETLKFDPALVTSCRIRPRSSMHPLRKTFAGRSRRSRRA